jgi:hypothetical protein
MTRDPRQTPPSDQRDVPGGTAGRPTVRCGFCGASLDDAVQRGATTCPGCGGDLQELPPAVQVERPPAASNPLTIALLLLIGGAVGVGITALPPLASRFVLGNAPVGMAMALTLGGCWWLVIAPLFAMAWADNLIRVLRLRPRLPLSGLAPVYLGVPAYLLMLWMAWPIARPYVAPMLSTPPSRSGPIAAPSAHEPALPEAPAR